MDQYLLMGSKNLVEGIGLAASALVCISLCMKNIKSLRIVNLIGSAVFLVYGILISSPSVIVLDGFSVMVNIYYLFKMRGTRRTDLFDVQFINSPADDQVGRFIRFHGDDIVRFFPSFSPDLSLGTLAGAECCFILRETLPVSLVAYRREKDDEIRILVDYVIPAYRDLENAKFFFSNAVNRIAAPGTVFHAVGEVPAHCAYLRKIGFVETGREEKIVHFKKAVS
jgi:hypothetical protein